MKLDILAFGARPDDVEISSGGTILKYISEGKKIGIIDLTKGELGTRGSAELRMEEAKKASTLLSLSIRKNLNMKDGFFEETEENKLKIIQEIRTYQPEIVLANSISDRHPDHGNAGKLIADACFLAGLQKIETKIDGIVQEAFRPRLVLHYIQDYFIEPDIAIDVSAFTEEKIKVIQSYKSQFFDPQSSEPNTPISGEEFFDFLKGRMLTVGRPFGAMHAEGFTISRIFGVKDLFQLL